MHRAVSMRLGPLPCPPRQVLRRIPGHPCLGVTEAPSPVFTFRPLSHHPQPRPGLAALPVAVSASQARGICSTAPVWKGRRGGASALMPKKSGPFRRKTPGAGKKKKPKEHGAPMSRIHRDQRIEEDAAAKLAALKAIPAEDRARVQEMAEAFLNTPLGAQHDSMNMYLKEKDPDAMMLNLGFPLSDDHRHAVAGGTGHGEGGFSLPSGIGEDIRIGDDSGPSTATLSAGAEIPPMFSGVPLPSARQPGQPFGMNGYPSPPRPTSLSPQIDSSLTSNAVADGGGGGRGRVDDFNLLVRTLGAHGRFEEARSTVMPEMMRRGIRPDQRTLSALLAGAAVIKNPSAAEEVWSEMVQGGVKPLASSWVARIDAHSRGGRMRRAHEIGREMREQGHPWGVEAYTSLIAGSTRSRNYQGAWKLWNEMIMWGVEPDAMAYNTMIKLCAETRQYERAMTFLDEMDMKDIRPSRITMETLIRAAATAPQWIRAYGGIVDDLVQRFIGLGVTPHIDTYRALLIAYGSGGDADKVLQCIEEAHLLAGHTADLIGDGTPKLPSRAYCDALDAIAKCNSAGRHRGTRPRWGVLPGQDALVMDISALDVPEEDFDRVKQMQMSTMEWDESGEAALKKGFRKGKRTKFMGVTTPKDIIGDDQYERAIEDEYERVIQKAKAMKKLEEREKLLQLGIDPDAKDKIAKTRPRVLPHPNDRQPISSPVPHWLTGEDPDALLPGFAPPTGSSEEQDPDQLRISDGLEGLNGGGQGGGERSWELEGGQELDEDDGGVWRTQDGWEEEEEDKGDPEQESWGKKYLSAQEQSPRRENVDTVSKGTEVSSRRSREVSPGGLFRRVTMLDLLEGDQALGEDAKGGGGSRGDPDADVGSDAFALPENLEDMMEEVRRLAQEDLERKKRRHLHLKAEEEGDEDGDWEDLEEEEAEEGEGRLSVDTEEEEEEEEFGMEGVSSAREEPEAQADAVFEAMMAKAAVRGEGREQQQQQQQRNDDGSDIHAASFYDGDDEEETSALTADSGGGDDATNLLHDGSSLIDQLEQLQIQEQHTIDDQVEEKEDEYEDWTPLMHEDTNVRTHALMGVVRLLEVDAMEAARVADAEKGFGPGGPREGEGPGPAVRQTLWARLRTLTEARKVRKALKFVEEEYPKEGAKLDVEATLAVVEMFINARNVELAEEFEQKRREEGLPPNRSRILGAILNARARRAVAWTQDIVHVKRVLDTMQKHRIKPHGNELRFVRQLVDKGKFDHSWLPADPDAHVKRVR
ncbi:unnamed protein product, partial [Hapterophycus canaliculatus]